MRRVIYSRDQVASAVHHWGQHGSGRAPFTLTVEASKLVDILGAMDYERIDQVQVDDETPRGKLLLEATAALQLEAARRASNPASPSET